MTSDYDATHNCVAYAADDKSRKWDWSSLPLPGYYWPATASKGYGIESLKSAFEAIGYEICGNGDVEDGFEKVALYVDEHGFWTHAAKQEPSGEWSSKLGNSEDIRHRTPHCFGGSIYGNVMHFMKRPTNVEQEEAPSV